MPVEAAEAGDEIRKRRANMMPTEGRVLRSGPQGLTIELEMDGEEEPFTYELVVLYDDGANNAVYSVSSIVDEQSVPLDDILIRLARPPKNEAELRNYDAERVQEEHADELGIGMRLAEKGISPYIYLNLSIETENTELTLLGTAMERFDYSLRDVASCPTLMRRFFVECDGESALVDLYVRAARYARCIDTKPSNVVVNLPGSEKKRRDPRRIIALIDTDDRNCAFVDETKAITGRFEVGDLESYLGSKKPPFKPKSMLLDKNPVLVATVSLLMHVAVSAIDDHKDFGFPYPRITKALVDNWEIVEDLANADHSQTEGRTMADNHRVLDSIEQYCNHPTLGSVCNWDGLREFLDEATKTFKTRALVACSARPELYEFVAQIDFEDPKYSTRDSLHSRDVTPASLEALVQRLSGGVKRWCKLEHLCPYHLDKSEFVHYTPQDPHQRRSIRVHEIPDKRYDKLIQSMEKKGVMSLSVNVNAARSVYHALLPDHGQASAIEVASLLHHSTKIHKGVGKWLRKRGVTKSLAEKAQKAIVGPMVDHV